MTTDSTTLAREFACPSSQNDDRRKREVARLTSRSARTHVIGFLRRRGELLADRTEGLIEVLECFANTETQEAGLAFPLWSLSNSLSKDEWDHVHTACQIAGHLYRPGADFRWRAQLRSPKPIRIDRYATPSVEAVEMDGDDIEIRTAAGTTSAKIGSPALRALGSIEIDLERRLMIAGAEEEELLQLNDSKGFSAEPRQTRLAEIEEAVRLTRAHAPEYLVWYGDAVRVVASLPTSSRTVVQSGSRTGQPGIVYASSPITAIRLAETLVHEASHQYFQLAQLDLRFHTMADERLYWSPYPKKHRHIDKILLAYHAFANVALFYRRVLQSADAPEVREQAVWSLEDTLPNLRIYEDHLENSNGLTAHGRALFTALAERLAS